MTDQTTRQNRLDRLRGVGIEGSQSRGSESSTRERRGAQREQVFSQRFGSQFKLVDGVVTLDLEDGEKVREEWSRGGTENGAATPLAVGFVAGPTIVSSGQDAYFTWAIPPVADTNKPITVSIYWVEHNGSGTGTLAFDLDLYELRVSTTSVSGGTAIVTGSDSVTVGSEGDLHLAELTIPPGKLSSDAVSVWLHAEITTASSTGSIGALFANIYSTFSLRDNHTHG